MYSHYQKMICPDCNGDCDLEKGRDKAGHEVVIPVCPRCQKKAKTLKK